MYYNVMYYNVMYYNVMYYNVMYYNVMYYNVMYYNVTLRPVRANIVVVEKQRVLHNLSVCIVRLGTQHAMHVRRIAIWGLPPSTVFSTFSLKRHDFREQSYLTQLCVWICSVTPVRKISHSEKK
jgi:hypothetical protein